MSLKLNKNMATPSASQRRSRTEDGEARPVNGFGPDAAGLDGQSSIPLEASLFERAERLKLSPSARWPALRLLFLLADAAALATGAFLAGLFAALDAAPTAVFAAAVVAMWIGIGWLVGVYAGDDLRAWATGVPTTPRLVITALSVTWPAYAVLVQLHAANASAIALLAVGSGALMSASGRALARGFVHRKPSLRHQALIVGSGMIASQLVNKLRTQPQFGLDPAGFIDDDPHMPEEAQVPHLGRLSELSNVLQRHSIDRVIFAFSRSGHDELLRGIRDARAANAAVDIVPRLFELLDGVPGLVNIGGLPLISLSVPRLDRTSRAVKRALDVGVAIALLALLAPALLLIAIAIKLESPGPVLFRQRRVGRDGNRFDVLKFRSMYIDADQRKAEFAALNDVYDGVMFKIHNDPRVTPIGRVLRRYSIDELPQLINVLRGEMSLVGPRPLIEPEAEALDQDWHARRLDLRPGLTGPWQVSGRSDTTVEEMVRFDYSYVAGWSLARDVELLLATVPAVLSGRGAY